MLVVLYTRFDATRPSTGTAAQVGLLFNVPKKWQRGKTCNELNMKKNLGVRNSRVAGWMVATTRVALGCYAVVVGWMDGWIERNSSGTEYRVYRSTLGWFELWGLGRFVTWIGYFAPLHHEWMTYWWWMNVNFKENLPLCSFHRFYCDSSDCLRSGGKLMVS